MASTWTVAQALNGNALNTSNRKSYICSDCIAVFTHKSSARRHVANVHMAKGGEAIVETWQDGKQID